MTIASSSSSPASSDASLVLVQAEMALERTFRDVLSASSLWLDLDSPSFDVAQDKLCERVPGLKWPGARLIANSKSFLLNCSLGEVILKRTSCHSWGARLRREKRPRRGECPLFEAVKPSCRVWRFERWSLRTGQELHAESERMISPRLGSQELLSRGAIV
jgi:hypothetical protein